MKKRGHLSESTFTKIIKGSSQAPVILDLILLTKSFSEQIINSYVINSSHALRPAMLQMLGSYFLADSLPMSK